jgi:phosphohistidine phosphatase SixA
MLRCRQTAEILAECLGSRVELLEQKELLPDGDFAKLWAWTSEMSRQHEQIALVGHRPQVNEYVATLIGVPSRGIRFAKGAAAAIHFDGDFTPGHGELQWLITAKMLGV